MLHKMLFRSFSISDKSVFSPVDWIVRVSRTFANAMINQNRKGRLKLQSTEDAISCWACYRSGDQCKTKENTGVRLHAQQVDSSLTSRPRMDVLPSWFSARRVSLRTFIRFR